MFRRQVKLAQTFEAFEAQAKRFLTKNSFPVTAEYLKIYGSFVQMLPASQDHYDPRQLASAIRKAVANEQAFYLIHPEKRPKAESAPEVADEGSPKAPSQVG